MTIVFVNLRSDVFLQTRPSWIFATSAAACYNAQCKHASDLYAPGEDGCLLSFWRNNSKMVKHFGDDWFTCHLFSPKYKLGFKFTDNFQTNNWAFIVSVDSCHQADVEQEWGKGPVSGKK